MIRCVVIDDEQFAVDVLVGYISKIHFLDVVGSSTDPLIGIQMIHEQNATLVFLDIQMDVMRGFDVLTSLPQNVKVIFCTAYSEFAADSYDAEAIDYLLKPVSFERFARAAQRAANVLTGRTSENEIEIPNDYIYIKTEQKGKIIRINLDDIDYIEGMKNYVAFHRGKEKILAYLTMKEMEERLPKSQFMRVHKSYIVPLNRIIKVENSYLIFKDRSDQIPLSDTYRNIFFERIGSKLIQ
jgi:two-component system LytT family response regulator